MIYSPVKTLEHPAIPADHVPARDHTLAGIITRDASKQTYYTIRFLVDRDRVQDAYRAYAYFRWVDDTLDGDWLTLAERSAFLHRQQSLLAYLRQGVHVDHLTPEETLLRDLLKNHPGNDTGLQVYLENMMAVMTFDAERRGRLITQAELDSYTHNLASAVTEAMHFFIGHCCHSPQDASRYQAVTGAHITHMLRDAVEDVAAGYVNMPREVIEAESIDPHDVENDAYRAWVASRVQQARDCFAVGRDYLAQVESVRCRMAGYAYTTRFEIVLDAIERDGYRLRRDYPERKSRSAMLRVIRSMLHGIVR